MTQASTSTTPNASKPASWEKRKPPAGLVPLELEARAALPTAEAALHLNRATQTLRLWSMRQDGPIQPLRINGRLAWPVSELRRLLGV